MCSKFFFFEPTTVNEIITCIGSHNANKGVSYDNIPDCFLEVTAPIIAPLPMFFNCVTGSSFEWNFF